MVAAEGSNRIIKRENPRRQGYHFWTLAPAFTPARREQNKVPARLLPVTIQEGCGKVVQSCVRTHKTGARYTWGVWVHQG